LVGLLGCCPAANVATLYVVSVPAGDPDDITLRALRVLGEVGCLVAGDVVQAQRLLDRYELNTELASLDDVDALASMLDSSDLALLADGWRSSPPPRALALIRLEGRYPVVPVPGSSLPITALVVSGLPADSCVYLGELPQQPEVRHTLLSSIRHERCTLLLLETPGHLSDQLTGLLEAVGDRKLVVAAASERGTQVLWRGTIGEALKQPPPGPLQDPRVLVVEGARGPAARWDEERLQGEVQAQLEKGLGAKQVSQQLAAESGWPRRDVYRLAVEASQLRGNE
jgi:16S rRNA (cytidine1402-2'-O)-methyltransferase